MGPRFNYGKGLYDQLAEVMARLDTVEKTHQEETFQMKEEISALRRENRELKEENRLLKEDNARMKSILNNDSSNTSLPPSSDQKGGRPANTYNSREKTGRRSGGQKGHKGTTLTKADVEENLRSGKYCHRIREIGKERGGDYTVKYVLDLEVVPVITEVRIYRGKEGTAAMGEEYRSDVCYGEQVKALAVMLYGEGVMSISRITSLLNDLGGGSLKLSEGSVYGFCRKFARKEERDVKCLEERLLNQEAVSTDATVVTLNGEQSFIRNFSTRDTVLYEGMEEKSLKALGEIAFLKKYTGILVHDHETALYHFGTEHGECNVHLLRYLKKNTEETGNSWSGKMGGLLSGINRARKEAVERGGKSFGPEEVRKYKEEYREILREGREENKKTEHKYAKKEEKKLLNRLEKYEKNHLLFAEDFRVPFDDNMSERDLRKAKNRQKMSGGFRKGSGQKMYCVILSILETLKRRGMPLLENIRKVFREKTPALF